MKTLWPFSLSLNKLWGNWTLKKKSVQANQFKIKFNRKIHQRIGIAIHKKENLNNNKKYEKMIHLIIEPQNQANEN